MCTRGKICFADGSLVITFAFRITCTHFEERLLVIVGCEAIERQVEYDGDIDMAIGVDCRQGEMERTEGICNVNLL